jgi:phosphotransferase system  glucose/maltose/N-acetylglucosamine-specific IIC component
MQFVQTFLDYIVSILVDLKHYQLILISLVIASLLPTLFFFVAKHKSVAARQFSC